MAFKRIENRQKIIKIISHLISTKSEIDVFLKSETTPFTSRVINADQNHPSLAKGTRAIIIVEKLLPEKGNNLIQSSPKITLKFVVLAQPCTCSVNYIGLSSEPPHFGFMLSMPEIIELEEKRLEKRTVFEAPDFQLAEVFIARGTKDERRYELEVVDSTDHGMGILIREKNIDILKSIKVGDVIKGINFYASNAMLKIDGVVRHITKAGEDKFKGGYFIGIQSKDILPGVKNRR